MLFGYPSAQEAHRLKSLLHDFSEASGMHVNCSKFQIFFFHTPPSVKIVVSNILGFLAASLPSKYLGAPLSASNLKHPTWRSLLEKLESRLNLWTHKSLNLASRIVLIKSVLQAMPLYLFSILAAPKWVLKSIRNLQRNFLWSSAATNRKWALVKWSNVCMPKEKGGIGLRDPEKSNSIMNAKIWWQWITCPDKPWGKIWTANFWEIRNGCTARFWTDAWNQWPKLQDILHPELIPAGLSQQHETIHQFWSSEMEHNFRIWKSSNQILPQADTQQQEELRIELQKRRIRQDNGADILRWGYLPKGSYTTTEAYNLLCSFSSPPDPVWSKIWKLGPWPKIAYFLWLVSHKIILTWDKLRKRNFHGPLFCPNCAQNEETLQHLLAACPLVSQLWDKERNQCIFKDKQSTSEETWRRIHKNIQETTTLQAWTKEDLPSTDNERNILDNWQLQLSLDSLKSNATIAHNKDVCQWQAPPTSTFKLNFDGASKGNPGDAGYGGIIRDSEGKPIRIYFGNIGWDTNNSAELEGLWQGLLQAGNLNFQPIIVEGDSQILINMATRLQNGSNARKIALSWRLEARLNALAKKLSNFNAISFSHTKREGNKVADLLANIGTENAHSLLSGDTNIISNRQQL
eukprot:PITA_01915